MHLKEASREKGRKSENNSDARKDGMVEARVCAEDKSRVREKVGRSQRTLRPQKLDGQR